MIDKKQQRLHYLLTIANDIKMKGYPLENQPKCLDQIGGGVKLFKDKWNSSFTIRLIFNLALPFIMLGYDIYVLLLYSVRVFFHKKKPLLTEKLFVSEHNRLFSVGQYAGLVTEDSVWFATPLDSYKIPAPHKSISVLDFLSIQQVWKCMLQSILCRWYSVIKFGYKTYFLSQKGFAWMVTDTALRMISTETELLFANNVDRIAMMIDFLPHKKKSLVQHGGLHFYHRSDNDPRFTYHEEYGFWTWNCLFRFHTLSRMYCYTEKDRIAYQISNMACNPEYIIIGYAFKPAFKPNKKSVLIIAEPPYRDKEEMIIKQLQGMDIEIYLKNHPVASDHYYDDMQNKYKFIFLPGRTKDLPAVDIVFSYDSTLAYEYEAVGADVLYYFTFDWNAIREIVKKKLNITN